MSECVYGAGVKVLLVVCCCDACPSSCWVPLFLLRPHPRLLCRAPDPATMNPGLRTPDRTGPTPNPEPRTLRSSVTEKRKGLFGPFGVRTCTAGDRHPSDPTGAVTGTLTGELVVWRQRCAVAVLPGFSDCVMAVKTVVGRGLVAGSADCSIRFWLADMTPGVWVLLV